MRLVMNTLERLARLDGIWLEMTDRNIDIGYTKVSWDQVPEKHL